MKRILFGISDTKECKNALHCFINLFGTFGDLRGELEVGLLRIIPEVLVYADAGVCAYNDLVAIQESETDDLFEAFEEELSKHKIRTKRIVEHGNPSDVLLEVAKEYDLLVIGESESSILHRIFNSHQDTFINSSPIPVLVAK